MTVINGQQMPMPIYRNMALVIRENRQFFFILCVAHAFYIDSVKFVSMFNFGSWQNLCHNFVSMFSYIILATIQVNAYVTSKSYMYNRLY